MRANEIITGVDGVLEFVGKKHPKLVGERWEDVARRICAIIKRRADYLCPKDTLALVLSGEIIIEGKGLNVKMRISYGGPDAPYALWVHEDQNKEHAAPTSAKWLERAIRETRGACANAAKTVMSAGVRLSKDGFEVE